MAGTSSTPYAAARSRSIAGFRISTAIRSVSPAISRTSCSFWRQRSPATSSWEKTVSLTGCAPNRSNSFRTAASSLAVRIAMALIVARRATRGQRRQAATRRSRSAGRAAASAAASARRAATASVAWSASMPTLRATAPRSAPAAPRRRTTIGSARRAAVSSSPRTRSRPPGSVKQSTRRPGCASWAAMAAGSAKPAVPSAFGTRHSPGATASHPRAAPSMAGQPSTAAMVPAGVSSRAGGAIRFGPRPAAPAARRAARTRRARSTSATSQSARARPRSRGASSSRTSPGAPTTSTAATYPWPVWRARPRWSTVAPSGQGAPPSSTASRPTAITRSARWRIGSAGAPPPRMPRARGWGSGIVPLPFKVVSTGAGSASASARTQPPSSARQPSPATTTGRLAASIRAAAASSAATSGAEGGRRPTVAGPGTASRSAAARGRARCTGPRGSAIASSAARATPREAESAATRRLCLARASPCTDGDPAGSVRRIIGARSSRACARPARAAGADSTAAAPGPSPSSPLTAAMTQAASAEWTATTGRPRAAADRSNAPVEPPAGTPKSRRAPAAARPSIRRSATLGTGPAPSRSEPGEDGRHAVERRPQVCLGGGVREPEVALAVLAERRPRQDGDARLLQQAVGDLGRLPPELLDVGEDIEGAARRPARHAGQAAEPLDDEVAAALELRHHALGRRLVALERGDPGQLGERRRAGVRVHHEPGQVLGERRRHDPVAEPPAGHRERLREPVEEDRVLAHPGQAQERHELALVEELAVDLVGEHRDPERARDLRHPLDLRPREDAAGRVLRRVDDDQLRLPADPLLEEPEVEAEPRLLQERNRHRHPAHEVDDRFVDGKAGVRVDHLVAAVDERHDREEHDRLRAGRDHDLLRSDGRAAGGRDVPGDRRAQLGESGRRPVVGRPRVEGALGGVADVLGRVEVGLADLEVNDLLALSFERLGPRQDLEGRLRSEPRHPVRDDHAADYTGARGVRGGGRGLVLDGLGPGAAGRSAAASGVARPVLDRAHARHPGRVRRLPRPDGRRRAAVLGRPALRRPEPAGRRRLLARRGRVLPLARERLPPPHRGRVGEGGPRGPRGRALPVGRRAAARAVRPPAAGRHHAGEPARPDRSLRRLPRVVPRLGRRRLLPAFAAAEPARARRRPAPRLARRRLAPRGPVEPGRPPLLVAPGASLLRLRLPPRAGRRLSARRACRVRARALPYLDDARGPTGPAGRSHRRLDRGDRGRRLVSHLRHRPRAAA